MEETAAAIPLIPPYFVDLMDGGCPESGQERIVQKAKKASEKASNIKGFRDLPGYKISVLGIQNFGR